MNHSLTPAQLTGDYDYAVFSPEDLVSALTCLTYEICEEGEDTAPNVVRMFLRLTNLDYLAAGQDSLVPLGQEDRDALEYVGADSWRWANADELDIVATIWAQTGGSQDATSE